MAAEAGSQPGRDLGMVLQQGSRAMVKMALAMRVQGSSCLRSMHPAGLALHALPVCFLAGAFPAKLGANSGQKSFPAGSSDVCCGCGRVWHAGTRRDRATMEADDTLKLTPQEKEAILLLRQAERPLGPGATGGSGGQVPQAALPQHPVSAPAQVGLAWLGLAWQRRYGERVVCIWHVAAASFELQCSELL